MVMRDSGGEWEPFEGEGSSTHSDWVRVLMYMMRANLDTPTSVMQSAEFWIPGSGGKMQRDTERMKLAEEFANLAVEQMTAPCNLMSLQIEETEYFLSVGKLMVERWKRDHDAPGTPAALVAAVPDDDDEHGDDEDYSAFNDEDGDEDYVPARAAKFTLPGAVYRQDFAGILPDKSPEASAAWRQLPYAIIRQDDVRTLEAEIERREKWLIKQAEIDAEDKAMGVYEDYGDLVKLYREQDVDRLLAGAKTARAPYFQQLLNALVDSSAAGAQRMQGMALVGRILADIAGGGAPPVEQQRRMQAKSRRSGSSNDNDNE